MYKLLVFKFNFLHFLSVKHHSRFKDLMIKMYELLLIQLRLETKWLCNHYFKILELLKSIIFNYIYHDITDM